MVMFLLFELNELLVFEKTIFQDESKSCLSLGWITSCSFRKEPALIL